MDFSKKQKMNISDLITRLDKDRAWLLEQIDRGNWAEFRLDLAALERELGQLLIRVSEGLNEGKNSES